MFKSMFKFNDTAETPTQPDILRGINARRLLDTYNRQHHAACERRSEIQNEINRLQVELFTTDISIKAIEASMEVLSDSLSQEQKQAEQLEKLALLSDQDFIDEVLGSGLRNDRTDERGSSS